MNISRPYSSGATRPSWQDVTAICCAGTVTKEKDPPQEPPQPQTKPSCAGTGVVDPTAARASRQFWPGSARKASNPVVDDPRTVDIFVTVEELDPLTVPLLCFFSEVVMSVLLVLLPNKAVVDVLVDVVVFGLNGASVVVTVVVLEVVVVVVTDVVIVDVVVEETVVLVMEMVVLVSVNVELVCVVVFELTFEITGDASTVGLLGFLELHEIVAEPSQPKKPANARSSRTTAITFADLQATMMVFPAARQTCRHRLSCT